MENGNFSRIMWKSIIGLSECEHIRNWDEEKIICYQRKITCQRLAWMLQSSSEWKWRSGNKRYYLPMHYWDTRHWRTESSGSAQPKNCLHHLNRVRLTVNFHCWAGRRRDTSWLLDHCDEEAGREVQSSPTFESVSSSSATHSRERMVLSPSVLSS